MAEHAFLWNGSSMQDLGTFGGTDSYATAINTNGWVIGTAYTAGNAARHAFLWNGSNMIDLNTVLPAGSPLVLQQAIDINDVGQIIAEGYSTVDYTNHAVVLTPPVQFNFTGFFAPVDNPSVTNLVKAGQAVPVKFSLGGNQGLNIFAAGYPATQAANCANLGGTDEIDQTVAAGASSLQYDATTNLYTYVWKTNTAWANSCRVLTLKFSDGSQHTANFQFKK